MLDPTSKIEKAIDENSSFNLAKNATQEELERLRLAEEVMRLAHERRKNTSSWTLISQSIVGIVAVVGMLINAYQNYNNKQQQQHQQQIDQERWSKEFLRAQRADKYRAFFETSVLATDPTNPDKRLVGYALLQEFVDDDDYNSKATRLLEESLVQELRTNTNAGIDEGHRNAVLAIVNALSDSSDCKALERAARSIDKIAKRHAREQDAEETSEIFKIYVRRLVGHATIVCKTMKDFTSVRKPLAETVVRAPEIIGAKGKLSLTEANVMISQLLVDLCREEVSVTGVSECPQIFQKAVAACAESTKAGNKEELPSCLVINAGGLEFAKATGSNNTNNGAAK